MTRDILYALALLGCFLGSAFFAGTEMGVLSVNRARVMYLVRNGVQAAKLLAAYLHDMQRFLALVLVGNNLSAVMLSVVSASFSMRVFPEAHLAQTVWAAAVACMVVFFAEYLPKLFFASRPLRRTLPAIRVFRVVDYAIGPLARVILWLTQFLMFGKKHEDDKQFLVTRQYIDDLVRNPKDGAAITSIERAMIRRVLRLPNKTAAEILTPVQAFASITEDSPLEEVFETVRRSGHMRLPVFNRDRTACIGVLATLDMFAVSPDLTRGCVRTFMRPPMFVNADMPADELLPLMRRKRQHLVLVREPQTRRLLGLVTTENVLSVITGELAGKENTK